MKKLIVIALLSLIVVNCFLISVFAQDSENIHGYATYTDTTPIIDGKTDDVWQFAQAYSSLKNCVDGQAYAAFKIMWDENHLYFYAKVYDETISGCGEDSVTNGINFWVSETNSNLDTFMNLPGDWHVFCNQNANTNYYTGNVLITEQSLRATEIYDGYYIVECAVPIQTEGLTYQNGHIIGFDVSVDDDINGDNVREYYCFWEYLGKYWEETSALANVQLIGKEDSEEEPPEPTDGPTVPSEPSDEPAVPSVPADDPEELGANNILIRVLLAIWNFILKLFGVL